MKDLESPVVFQGHSGNRIVGDIHEPRGHQHGNPVLLLHGGGQTRHAWGGAARRIADAGHAAFTVDQRGHGDSAWVEDLAYSSEDYAADAVAICREIAVNSGRAPVLVGASLGGISGMLAGHMGGPDLLAGLVLVDITPHMDAEGVSKIQGFMAERMREGFATLEEAAGAIAAYLPNRPPPRSLEGLAKNLRKGPDGRYRWHWDPAFIAGPRTINTGGETVQKNLIAAVRSLTIPVLLVRGQQSELVTEEAVQAFREMAPHADYVDVSGAGHMVAGDRNDAFNDAVLGFLDKLEGRDRESA
ncbi:MAG: alpha/beta hydrolase [Hoeflea sp.]|uniref:alpha/beta fold hydrolase n=1 Tax=Hoeflea sp. TaxID=1940281 RepID=UPI001D520976|nr:alpha/beta hydrolase [Hoeflea sp.]MBU4530663.1 alpha/beta hydrolase [Alphaproteobacteria bacterium]MBU4544883.1 alpha/beta hydrolase [Alphaproteobacteria bacterium]MBU4552026.1 alpha/beta hydrolase [Alphaproteobacteria bacterium]MBV1722215.1 alpha/beta hydrolase [Hoeflea sp.]MBV1761777.1 alpha/beta hydrolase [Hoeflea sp.]